MEQFFEQIIAMKQEILLIIVMAAIAFMSIVSFILYGVDKSKAKREKWRIPEAVLLGWGFFGGAVGALGREPNDGETVSGTAARGEVLCADV